MNIALGLSVTSFVWVTGVVVHYFSTIPKARVPVKVTGLALKMLLGLGVSGAAFFLAYQRGSLGALVYVPAGFASMLALFLLWLLTQRKTPIGDLKVKVGDKLLAFEAMTSEGLRFHTDELAGKRTLLKFFRGGW